MFYQLLKCMIWCLTLIWQTLGCNFRNAVSGFICFCLVLFCFLLIFLLHVFWIFFKLCPQLYRIAEWFLHLLFAFHLGDVCGHILKDKFALNRHVHAINESIKSILFPVMLFFILAFPSDFFQYPYLFLHSASVLACFLLSLLEPLTHLSHLLEFQKLIVPTSLPHLNAWVSF